MTSFIERMEVEEQELRNKLNKLTLFIYQSDVYKGLHEFEQRLLNEQLNGMSKYHGALSKRICFHKKG